MKGYALIAVIICISILLCSCNTFGEIYIDNADKYGEAHFGVELEDYFPTDIKDYTVNAYSYRVYAYLDISYEAVLDITVTEQQLDQIIEEIKGKRPDYTETESYYAEGYTELVFNDEYTINRADRAQSEEASVYHALIKKVIYSPEELRIIFVDFDPFDSYVYPLSEVEYFNMFGIDEEEYLNWLNVRAFEASDTGEIS